MKSVQIRSFLWSVFSCARAEYSKKRTRKNSLFGHFSRIGRFNVKFEKGRSNFNFVDVVLIRSFDKAETFCRYMPK